MNLTCRVPGSGAPLASLDGQVFWLTARRAPDGLPASRQWRFLSGGLAEYSGGPAPGSHRLPYSLVSRKKCTNPCSCETIVCTIPVASAAWCDRQA